MAPHVLVKVAQSCLTLCEPMDYTVHGILQARILEWVAFPFSRGSFQPRDWTQVSHLGGGFFTSWATRKPKNTGVDLPDLGIELGSPALQADSLPAELSGVHAYVKWFHKNPALGPQDNTAEAFVLDRGLKSTNLVWT